MGRPRGRRGLCGAVGPLASGQHTTAIADHGPLLRWGGRDAVGALERERGGVASVLGSPPLLPFPGPKACVRAGGRLAPQGPVMMETPRVSAVPRAGPRVWLTKLSLWDFLGGVATMET